MLCIAPQTAKLANFKAVYSDIQLQNVSTLTYPVLLTSMYVNQFLIIAGRQYFDIFKY